MTIFEAQLRDFEEAIRLDPKDANFYVNRASLKSDLDDIRGAMRDYDEAIRLAPKSDDGYLGRGWLNHTRGEFKAAIADYQETTRHTSEPNAKNNLAFLYATCPEEPFRDVIKAPLWPSRCSRRILKTLTR
ncbi:MAG: hypothetical protein QM811_00235 [Pirellulales bacterium]